MNNISMETKVVNTCTCSTCGSSKPQKEIKEIKYAGKSRYVCKNAIQCGQNISKNAPITTQRCVHCQREIPSNMMTCCSQNGQLIYECENRGSCRDISWKLLVRRQQPKLSGKPEGELIQLFCVTRDAIMTYYHPERQKFFSKTISQEDWYETELWRIKEIVRKLKTDHEDYDRTEIAPYLDEIHHKYNQEEEEDGDFSIHP
jgi:hypothetical protein